MFVNIIPVWAHLTERFSSRPTSLVANKPLPSQFHDTFSTLSSLMHHMSGLSPNCCYSLVKLLSLTYVCTPQYSLQHPIFAYVPRGSTSGLSLLRAELPYMYTGFFSSAQQFWHTSGVMAHSKYLYSISRPGKNCPPALKLGPRYADSFMERMDLLPAFHARINVTPTQVLPPYRLSCTAFLQKARYIHLSIHLPSPLSFLAIHMRHHSHPSVLPTDILLEKVPPLYGGHRATLSLNIVIVGAGLGGLAATHAPSHAGHRTTLLESASVLGDVGAGTQVSPNATPILHR